MRLATFLCAMLFATAAFAHDVQLSCTPGSGGGSVTGFVFARSATSGGPYTDLNSTPLSSCSFDDASAAVQSEGAKFFYVVRATGPGGASPNSAETGVTIPFSAPATPSAPTAVPK